MTEYAGLATRTVAFAVDAAIINVVVWAVAAIVALGLSLLKVPDTVMTVLAVIGAGIAIVWSVAYFAFFWSSTGQTPGNRLLGIQVVEARSCRAAARSGGPCCACSPCRWRRCRCARAS